MSEKLMQEAAKEPSRSEKIDAMFPAAKRNSVAFFEGKYYLKKFFPVEIDPDTQKVRKWSHEWMEIDPKKPVFYTSTNLTETDVAMALKQGDDTAADRMVKVLRLAGKMEMPDEARIDYMCDALSAASGENEVEFEGVRYKRWHEIKNFKRYRDAAGVNRKKPRWEYLGWKPVDS